MATRHSIKEKVMDRMIELIVDNYPVNAEGLPALNPDLYRRVIDEGTGKVTTDSTKGSSTVIYQEDYQNFREEFTEKLDSIVDRYCCISCPLDTVNHECAGEYNEYQDSDVIWRAQDASTADVWFDKCVGTYDSNGMECISLGIAECGNTGGDCSPVYQDPTGESFMDYWFEFNLAGYGHGNPGPLMVDENVLTYFSQFISFGNSRTTIDPNQAEEVLDTTIFELLPTGLSRQERIIKWFQEFEALVGDKPNFNFDVDSDAIQDTWENDVPGNQDQHSTNSDIINNPDGNITRLNRHITDPNDQNAGKTLESLRNRLNDYLTDIDKVIEPEVSDERPEYFNKSKGYLKIRNLNQSIIIRSQEGQDVGLVGNDPENPLWLDDGFTITMWVRFLDKKSGGTLFNFGNPFRENNPYGFALETFTLHKDGIIREDSPEGETWGQWIDCKTDWGQIGLDWPEYCTDGNGSHLGAADYFAADHTFFKDTDYERFVRLVVREKPTPNKPKGPLRDSHVGLSKGREGYVAKRLPSVDDVRYIVANEYSRYPDNWGGTIPTAPLWAMGDAFFEGYTCSGVLDYGHCNFYPTKLLQHTRIPTDSNEWYFIVANYNPDVEEKDLCVSAYEPDSQCSCHPEFEPSSMTVLPDESEVLCGGGTPEYCPTDGNCYVDVESCPEPNIPGGFQCAPNGITSLKYFSDYWRWNVIPEGIQSTDVEANSNPWYSEGHLIGKYTNYSGEGAKCKVEVMSKSDLVRAQGFKPEQS